MSHFSDKIIIFIIKLGIFAGNIKKRDMVQSMTGYGKGEAILEKGKLLVEIRTLNSKGADINLKSSLLPKDKEIEIRKKIAQRLQRGTIDVFITFSADAAANAKQINQDLALQYYDEIRQLGEKIGAVNLPAQEPNYLLATILRMPDVLDQAKTEIITEENYPLVEKAFDDALDSLCEFRQKEGAILKADVSAKVAAILEYSKEVETFEAERITAVREKIQAKLGELSADPDPSRLEQEIIFYIEKLDINEERVRLRQHCKYYLETLENDPFPGKKLGFIAQEMGREINTTGSKANHTEIQKLVVKMKDELEKIKEQSLNIL